jgi:hypothetical protein
MGRETQVVYEVLELLKIEVSRPFLEIYERQKIRLEFLNITQYNNI